MPTDPRTHLGRRGFTINGVLILILVASVVLSTSVFLNVGEELALGASMRRARLSASAEAVVADMEERLLATTQQLSGALGQTDLALLNTKVGELAVPGGLTLDHGGTGWRVIEVRDRERIPHDERPLATWTDHPRLAYAGIPPLGGMVSARTLVVAVYATVRDGGGASFRVRRDLAISRIPPHQHALYVSGDAEICASATAENAVSGSVRIDGVLWAKSCQGIIRFTGGIEARDGIDVELPSTHYVMGSDGQLPLASVSGQELGLSRPLARWSGRVRVDAALGGPVGPGRLSNAFIAGSGECDDVPAAGGVSCAGTARYFPSVQIQRTSSGPGREFTVVCGAPYERDTCAEASAGVSYVPWPFNGPLPAGTAAPDPEAPGLPWRGLLADARRETRCTASVGGNSFRTGRCPTNLYGFRLDVGAMPALRGGVLSIRRAAGQAGGADPTGAQEIVLLTNAAALPGPLTVHSEIPVYLAGDFNTSTAAEYSGPPPAKIHAPRIVVLPNEATAQLLTSTVWDSVPRFGSGTPASEPLRAESNVTIVAVLRSLYCRSVGGHYFGGVWDGVPAVLGDWSSSGLRIIGALEATESPTNAAACAAFAPAFGNEAEGTTRQPAFRTVFYDERLLSPAFQPPGGWSRLNVAFAGPSAVPGRTPERQARAIGGTVAVRRVRDNQHGLPIIPPAVPIP